MAISSKVNICNMAISYLGNYAGVNDIDSPRSSSETVFALWYDICRQALLKQMMPNFALQRKKVALQGDNPNPGYAYQYEYPFDCLKLLGIGDVSDKCNDYTVEDNKIFSDINYSDGMPIRYIGDIMDITKYSPDFKILFAQFLAAHVALPITQDGDKAKTIRDMLPAGMITVSGLQAQENMPVRISHSRFRAARRGVPSQVTKK